MIAGLGQWGLSHRCRLSFWSIRNVLDTGGGDGLQHRIVNMLHVVELHTYHLQISFCAHFALLKDKEMVKANLGILGKKVGGGIE